MAAPNKSRTMPRSMVGPMQIPAVRFAPALSVYSNSISGEPPAAVTSRAARSLLLMPPVPRLLRLGPAISAIELSMFGTVVSTFAAGLVRGSES